MANWLCALLVTLIHRTESIWAGALGVNADRPVTANSTYRLSFQENGIASARPVLQVAVSAQRPFRSNYLCPPVCLSTHATLRRHVSPS